MMVSLRVGSIAAFGAFILLLQLASASAQTKITIGAAAMSPRTIPLLIA